MLIYLYFLCTIAFSVILTFGLVFVSPVFLISFFPLWETFEMLFNFIFSLFCGSDPSVHIKLDEIPDDCTVLAVIPVVLQSEDEDNAVFKNLERMYLANRGKRIKFGIVADLCDSKTATLHTDERISDHAYGRILALCAKYGNDFVLFERSRSYSKSEEMFIGRNRKAGAICELVSFLRGDGNTFSERSANLALQVLPKEGVKYLVTVNTDSDPGLWAIADMCKAISAPPSTVCIGKEKGFVTGGCGVIGADYDTLYPKRQTLFSRIMHHNESLRTDTASRTCRNIFGRDIFCGEGIIDVDAFYEMIVKRNSFPDDSIPNQDILTGMKLGCKRMSSSNQKTNLPGDPQSYLASQHYHIRADVRNLIYIFPYIRFSKEDKRRNTIDAVSRFMLFNRVRSATVPAFAVLGIFLSVFVERNIGHPMTFVSLCYLAVPFICTVLQADIKSILPSFAGTILSVAMLPMSAFCAADAVLKGVYRSMISKKKLLEQQPYSATKNERNGLLVCVYRNMFCVFSGFLLFAIAPFGALRFIAMLWFVFPVIAYHTSIAKEEKGKCSDDRTDESTEVITEIWEYFNENITDTNNYLPHIGLSAEDTENMLQVTSPKNIGFYFLFLLYARDRGIITTVELEKRLLSTLDTAEKLPKYNGHLYSMYDSNKLTPIPPWYVSSADNGFFTACIITLVQGLTEYICESTSVLEITKRLTEIDNAMKCGFLYDSSCDLFYKGIRVHGDKSINIPDEHCDTPTAEAIILGYIRCARRTVPKEHWYKLRPCSATELCGLLSHIFLLIYKDLQCSGKLKECDDFAVKRFISAFGCSMSRRFMCDGVMRCADGLLKGNRNE